MQVGTRKRGRTKKELQKSTQGLVLLLLVKSSTHAQGSSVPPGRKQLRDGWGGCELQGGLGLPKMLGDIGLDHPE